MSRLVTEWQKWLQSRGFYAKVSQETTHDVEVNQSAASNTTSSSPSEQAISTPVNNSTWPGFVSRLPGVLKAGVTTKGKSVSTLHTGIACVASLLLLLLMYQLTVLVTGPNAEIGQAFDGMALVSSPNFNCSELRLKGNKVIREGQHYHIFPSADVNPRNTCQSKFQQHCFRKFSGPKQLPPQKFLTRLREYEAYHEKCTKGLDLKALAVSGDAPEGCKYLVWKAMDGMGNQLLSLVCAFIYSLLTNRAMVIVTDSHIDDYICNPFPHSSWVLPKDFPDWQLRNSAKRVHKFLDETLAATQRKHSCNSIPPAELPHYISQAPKHLYAYIICCDARRDHQFFCPTAQKLFSGSNWFFYKSHEYTLPGLYFIPEFRETLNDWFPHHDVFMHASRYLLNPVNKLWARISQFYKAHMDGVDRQIGIQPRAWKTEYVPSISRQILRCAVDEKLLPKLLKTPKVVQNDTTGMRHPNISVLVTSLRGEYRDKLALQYARFLNAESLEVDVLSASSEGVQKTGDAAHDEKAIIDIWLLSFAHDLVTTPFSTFGSTASGLAGIVPLVFNNYGDDKVLEPACGRTNAGGPCFIVFPRNQPCDLDPPRSSIFDPDQKVPEVKYCRFNPGLGIETV